MILYVITNTANGKKYVGITTKTAAIRWRQHLRRVAAGSGHALHRAIAKYGEEAFRVDAIAQADCLDALKALEVAEIARLGTLGAGGYNMTAGGDGAAGYSHSDDEREARRRRRLGARHTEEAKAKIRETHQGKRLSADHIAALVAANTGRPMSDRQRQALHERDISDQERLERRERALGNSWSVGIKRTPEQCAAIGDRSRGRKASDETRAKIRERRAEQLPTFGMLGKSHSDDTRAKMRAAKVGRKKSPETIERMREAARRRMAEGRNGAVNR